MLARLVSKAIWLSLASALTFFGTGFLGYAIWTGLVPSLGEAWGAAVTALILLTGPLLAALILGLRRRKPAWGGEETMATIMTGMAKDRPLLLLLGAALLGAADLFLKKRK